MRTRVYVDGFNFYYGCVKGTPFRWLNFEELFRRLLPPNDIQAVKYFAARLEASSEDPDQPTRQDTYSHLLHDAHRALMDCAVIVSNDSDLAEPIRLARKDLGLKIGLISPTYLPGRHPSRQLARHADFIKKIRGGVLKDSLFPDPVLGPQGPIHKPRGW